MADNRENIPLRNGGRDERAASPGESAKNYTYTIEKFSGDTEHDRAIGERVIAVNQLWREPLDPGLLGEVDKRIIDIFDQSRTERNSRPSAREQEVIALMNELHIGEAARAGKTPMSLDDMFEKMGSQTVAERRASLRGMRTIGNGFIREAAGRNDMTLRRVGELIGLRVDMMEADILLKDPRFTDDQKQGVAAKLQAVFHEYAQTDDIPGRFKQNFAKVADRLGEYQLTHKAPAAPPPEVPRTGDIPDRFKRDFTEVVDGLTQYQERARGIAVKLEYDPSHKLFGKENSLQTGDVRHMQEKIEALMREANPKNAFEVAKLVAHLKRAGVRVAAGNEQLGAYLQRQRAAMQKHGPRALAQYLTYGKYAGFVNELSEQEHKWLLASIQDRIRNDQTHKGLTRLAMNARYLGVAHYTPDLVREGVLKEIAALQHAGNADETAAEAARARQAGIDPEAVFTTADGFAGRLKEKLVEHASAGRWDLYARLRNNLDVAWKHLPLLDKQVSSLVDYFSTVREQARVSGRWEQYAEYAAYVRELSNREGQRQLGKSMAPVTPHVPIESAQGPVETSLSAATPVEPAVTDRWWHRLWGNLFRRRERRPSDQETPTRTAA